MKFLCCCRTTGKRVVVANSAMGDERSFANPFPPYSPETAAPFGDMVTGSLSGAFAERVKSCVQTLADRVDQAIERGVDEGTRAKEDSSVYTGVAGVAWMYWILSQRLDDRRRRAMAAKMAPAALKYAYGKRCTLLCGDAGPLAVSAAIYNGLGQQSHADRDACLRRLHELSDAVCKQPLSSMPDELLYGRMGVVSALHFVDKHISEGSADRQLVDTLVTQVYTHGEQLVSQVPEFQPHTPLMWEWHGSNYLGAAHGLAGIFYVVMKTKSFTPNDARGVQLRAALDWCLTLAFPSGNMPSSVGRERDKLLHWCHGAPGWVHTFLLAHKLYGDDRYLSAAVKCGDVIWQRGLLRKGYGLCHGTAGNAYGFIALWQHTKQPQHLYRACRFAEWIFDYGRHGCGTPDRPFSLFEGMAGTIYFLVDLLNPSQAEFPMFD